MTTVTPESFVQRFASLADALPAGDLDALLHEFELQEAAAGEALIGEGTVTDAVFLVWEGELDVIVETPAGERKLGSVGRGEYLGEVSLMDPGPATATVVTQQGCIALRLSRDRFERLCVERAPLAAALLEEFLRTLSARIRTATTRLGTGDAAASSSEGLLGVHAALYQHDA